MPTYLGDYDKRRDRYATLYSKLKTDRASFDAHWRDLADFFMPRRTRFNPNDRNKGDKRNQNIIDSTARFSARTLSSGLHAGLTSPARPWMKLTTPDTALAKRPNVKAWLHEVTQRMLTMFAVTNLYNVLPLVYLDMGIFGTSAMAIVPDSKDLFRAYSYPIGSYVLGQDKRGLVRTFIREYELTVRQVVEEFGVQENGRDIDWTNISTQVKGAWDRGEYEESVMIVWVVKPNDYADERKFGAKWLPFTSCYYERDSNEKKFLRESGYKTFPVMAPRWDITGEDTYGTDSPGMTALGDNRQLQTQQRKKGQAIAKQIDPALVGPSSLRSQKTSLLPGDITYQDVREGMQGLKAIHEVNLNLADLKEDMADTRYRIQRAFYEDLFLMLARSDDMRGVQPVTAREIDERHEEKLLALGPVLERTNDELLDPLVDRIFVMMLDAGLLPDPPEELHGVALKVEYVSILAQAQKLVGVVGQDRFLQSCAVLGQTFPEVKHKLNVFRAIDNYSDMLDVDPAIVKTDDEANASMQQEQQGTANMMRAEMAEKLAKAGKAAGETPVSGDSVLNKIVGQTTNPPGAIYSSPASPNPAPLPAPGA